MKHLNANLDNVTNVELKETATGSIRFLGVDGSGDIVQATLPPGGGGGAQIFTAQNEIQENEGYYFEATASSFTTPCWRVGTEVILTSTYAGEEDIAISGIINEIEDQLDEVTETFTHRRVHINTLVSEGSDGAFNGDLVTQAAGRFRLSTGSSGNYCLTVQTCLATDNSEFTGSRVPAGFPGGGDFTGVGVAGAPASTGANRFNPAGSPSAYTRQALPTDDRTAVYNTRNWARFPFWGWATEEDGSPILHPDTGIPSIVVAENGAGGNLGFNQQESTYGPAAAQNYTRSSVLPAPNFDLINWVPSNDPAYDADNNSQNLTDRNGNALMELAGNFFGNNFYSLVRPHAYATAGMGTSEPGNYGAYAEGGFIGFYRGDTLTDSYGEIGDVVSAGQLRRANETGDRTARNAFQRRSHRAQPFFVLSPGSTNVGYNKRVTVGNIGIFNQGWSPFFAVTSGSGAVRASDGRYYINATPNAPIIETSPLYDPDNPTTTAVDGFYLNGTFEQTRGLTVGTDWTVQLDRAVYRIDVNANSNAGALNAGRRWEFSKVSDRHVFGAQQKLTDEGQNIFGFREIEPIDPGQDEDTPTTNAVAYTTIQTGDGEIVATEANETLRFIAGDNVTIEVAEGTPDTITISSTDDAALTEITNVLEGTDVIDVSAATDGTPVDVSLGDIAYVSPTELYINVSATPDPSPVGLPSTFFLDTTNTDGNDANNDGFDDVTGEQITPLGWLRIGGETATIETHAVIDVTAGDAVYFIPDGSVVWFSATEQFANSTGAGQYIRPTDDLSTATGWLRLGDGDNAETTINNTINNANGVIDVSGATDAVPILAPDGYIAYVSPTELYINNTGGDVMVGLPSTFFSPIPTGWLRIGADATLPESTSASRIVTIDTSAGSDTITIPATGANARVVGHLLTTTNFAVQVFESLGSGDFGLVLPDTLIVRSTGNIEISFPQSTINGDVKIEIRK